MVLGIPNRLIVLGLLAMAFVIPRRTTIAGGVVQSTAEAISGSLSALGSTRIEPVFNPSIGLSGNIGERIVSRTFGAFSDDPTGDPGTIDPVITIDPTPDDPIDPLEYEKQIPVWQKLLMGDDYIP
tara:strand:- start:2181 stop:2558 length:378 start_codon:yes stop_codon:yes gene_type:complete